MAYSDLYTPFLKNSSQDTPVGFSERISGSPALPRGLKRFITDVGARDSSGIAELLRDESFYDNYLEGNLWRIHPAGVICIGVRDRLTDSANRTPAERALRDDEGIYHASSEYFAGYPGLFVRCREGADQLSWDQETLDHELTHHLNYRLLQYFFQRHLECEPPSSDLERSYQKFYRGYELLISEFPDAGLSPLILGSLSSQIHTFHENIGFLDGIGIADQVLIYRLSTTLAGFNMQDEILARLASMERSDMTRQIICCIDKEYYDFDITWLVGGDNHALYMLFHERFVANLNAVKRCFLLFGRMVVNGEDFEEMRYRALRLFLEASFESLPQEFVKEFEPELASIKEPQGRRTLRRVRRYVGLPKSYVDRVNELSRV